MFIFGYIKVYINNAAILKFKNCYSHLNIPIQNVIVNLTFYTYNMQSQDDNPKN